MQNVKNTVLGDKLRLLRGENTLYSIEKQSGISRGTLLRYENGEQVPGNQSLQKLANFYGVDIIALKKLWVADLFPENSLERQALMLWFKENKISISD
jgi:transcriptional regulator with XRE-family HTH domain